MNLLQTCRRPVFVFVPRPSSLVQTDQRADVQRPSRPPRRRGTPYCGPAAAGGGGVTQTPRRIKGRVGSGPSPPASLRHLSSSGEPAGRIDNSMSGPAASFHKHHFTALALCTRKKKPSFLSFNNPCGCFHALSSPPPSTLPPSWAEPKSPSSLTPPLDHLQVHVHPQNVAVNSVASSLIWPSEGRMEGRKWARGRERRERRESARGGDIVTLWCLSIEV